MSDQDPRNKNPDNAPQASEDDAGSIIDSFFSRAPGDVKWSSDEASWSKRVKEAEAKETKSQQSSRPSSHSSAKKPYQEVLPSAKSTPQWSGHHGKLSVDASARQQEAIHAARAVFDNDPNLSPAGREVMVKLAMSQASLESGRGLNSGLAMKCNNLFGIKGVGSDGTTEWRTREVFNGKEVFINAGFAKNTSLEDSFIQYGTFLKGHRYKHVLEAANRGDFEGAAHAIQEAGYATDPKYAQAVIGVGRSLPLNDNISAVASIHDIKVEQANVDLSAPKPKLAAAHPPRASLASHEIASTNKVADQKIAKSKSLPGITPITIS